MSRYRLLLLAPVVFLAAACADPYAPDSHAERAVTLPVQNTPHPDCPLLPDLPQVHEAADSTCS